MAKGDDFTLFVGDGNNDVVEAGLDEHDALRGHFDFALNNFFCSSFCHFIFNLKMG